jgi:hypothetical protein
MRFSFRRAGSPDIIQSQQNGTLIAPVLGKFHVKIFTYFRVRLQIIAQLMYLTSFLHTLSRPVLGDVRKIAIKCYTLVYDTTGVNVETE